MPKKSILFATRRAVKWAAWSGVFILPLCLVVITLEPFGPPDPRAHPQTMLPAQDNSFAQIASVIRHPRCMNCHTTTDFPRQNDDRRRHAQTVFRGPDNHGVPGLMCGTCHTDTNNDLGGIPGAPHWGLAPLSMAWEYMTDREICLQLKDRTRNGDRSVADLLTHMTEDPLVLWAWQPGLHPGGAARSTPPLELAEWKAVMESWVNANAPCPTEDQP